MIRWLPRALFLSLSLLTASCTATKLYQNVNAVDRWRLNVVEKKVQVGDFKIAYNERGEGEALFLIHGFGSDKESWNRVIDKIQAPMHIVAPDLPGWGRTTFLPQATYSLTEQAQRLDDFRKALGIEKLHIAGISMGGAIAGTYAGLYPDHVLSLSLIDSAGLQSPTPSDYFKALQEGDNPLILKKPADVDKLVPYVFYKDPKWSSVVKKVFFEQTGTRADKNEKLFAELVGSGPILETLLPKVKVQTQVIWGAEDRIIHISTIDVIKSLKPDVDVHIIPECGHAPIVEKVDETAKFIQSFVFKSTIFPT